MNVREIHPKMKTYLLCLVSCTLTPLLSASPKSLNGHLDR